MSERAPHSREPAVPRWMGMVALGFYLARVIELVSGYPAANLLWSCNVASVLVAIGLLYGRPTLNAIGVFMLTVGTPVWMIDVATGSPLYLSSVLTHFGIYGLGLIGVHYLGLPRRTWWLTLLVYTAGLVFGRLLGPPSENINFAYAIPPGWSAFGIPLESVPASLARWALSHPLYLLYNTLVCTVSALLCQLLMPVVGIAPRR